MTIETLILAIIAAAPALTSILGIIAAIFGFNKKVVELKNEIVKTKEYETLIDELTLAHKENRALMKKCNELIEEIEKIKPAKRGK